MDASTLEVKMLRCMYVLLLVGYATRDTFGYTLQPDLLSKEKMRKQSSKKSEARPSSPSLTCYNKGEVYSGW